MVNTVNLNTIGSVFDPGLASIAEIMNSSRIEWFVIAGWALDIHAGEKLREHKDIEISIWRDQLPNLVKYFSGFQIDTVIGHKRYEAISSESGIDSRGHLIIRGAANGSDIELFLTSRELGDWVFRKERSIHLPMDEAILKSPLGLRYLAPHLTLLYKAWFFPSMEQVLLDKPNDAEYIRRCWATDCEDFERTWPQLNWSQRVQLSGWLKTYTPEIPWRI